MEGSSSFVCQQSSRDHRGQLKVQTTGTHMGFHTLAENLMVPAMPGYLSHSFLSLLSLWDMLNMWKRSEKLHKEERRFLKNHQLYMSERHLPSAPVLLQRSGSQVPHQSPVREWTEALPGCGFVPAHLPQRLYLLEEKKWRDLVS